MGQSISNAAGKLGPGQVTARAGCLGCVLGRDGLLPIVGGRLDTSFVASDEWSGF